MSFVIPPAYKLTIRDIQHHMATAMRVDISHETISAVTDAVLDEVMVWQNRQLDEFYPVIFLDALRIKIRDGGLVVNKSAYMAIGVPLDGIKHFLESWIAKEESASSWAQVCVNLSNRGVKDVFIVCCNGFKGLPEEVKRVSDSLCAEAWFTSNPRIGRGTPQLVG